MRVRYTTWSVAVLMLSSAAVGFGAPKATRSAGKSSAAATAKSSAKKPAATRTTPSTHAVHATKTSAKRRASATKVARTHLQAAPTSDRITEIQSALSREGAYDGDMNGRWDGATVDAMRHFQSGHGLNPSGKIDALTLQKLGLGSQVSGLGAPVPASIPQASVAENTERTEHP